MSKWFEHNKQWTYLHKDKTKFILFSKEGNRGRLKSCIEIGWHSSIKYLGCISLPNLIRINVVTQELSKSKQIKIPTEAEKLLKLFLSDDAI